MPLTLKEFSARLSASKLITANDLRSVLAAVAPEDRPTDGESLANLLVRASKLTPFQARRLCEGKADKLVVGNYVILDQLGQGGMGSVYKAQHRQMKRVVALKVVRPD